MLHPDRCYILEEADIRPDVFLLTGDLADTGDGACYDDLAAILADAARRSGASVVLPAREPRGRGSAVAPPPSLRVLPGGRSFCPANFGKREICRLLHK